MKKIDAYHFPPHSNEYEYRGQLNKRAVRLYRFILLYLFSNLCFHPSSMAITNSVLTHQKKDIKNQDSLSKSKGTEQGTFIDPRDGKTYKTIKISKQTWMAENLAFKTNEGAWAYDNKVNNVSIYGYLYNWESSKKACPTGWHLPTDEEWRQMEMALGMSRADTGIDGFRGTIGCKLKKATGWHSKQEGNSSIGFDALPGGLYSAEDSTFTDIDYNAYFWTNTSPKAEFVWERDLFDTFNEISRNRYKVSFGFSVRCVKD